MVYCVFQGASDRFVATALFCHISKRSFADAFQRQNGRASQSEKTYEFPARKICAVKGMTLETDGEPFLNRSTY